MIVLIPYFLNIKKGCNGRKEVVKHCKGISNIYTNFYLLYICINQFKVNY